MMDVRFTAEASPAAVIAVSISPAPAGGSASRNTETARLYAGDWAVFATWCWSRNCPALPAGPAAVASYLTASTARLGPGALARRAAAIADQRRQHGYASPASDPAVKAVLRTARRSRSASRRAAPPVAAQLARMAAAGYVSACGGAPGRSELAWV